MTYREAFGFSPISYVVRSGAGLFRYQIDSESVAHVWQIVPSGPEPKVAWVHVPSFGHQAVVEAYLAGEL